VPSEPEPTDNTELPPLHNTCGFAFTEPGATDGWFTLIVTLAQVVVSQAPSALT
jgi:hypothetical protein